jgi:hypothetical protein
MILNDELKYLKSFSKLKLNTMEVQINNNQKIVINQNLKIEINITSYNKEHKVPFLYETWSWEGDESVLPYKWIELLKQSDLINKFTIEDLKEYIKEKYYKNPNFDKKSFYFITHRSDVAGCVYLNSNSNSQSNSIKEGDKLSVVEFLLLNKKKHGDKGVEEALINLAVNRAQSLNLSEEKVKSIFVDMSTSNIDEKKIKSIIN